MHAVTFTRKDESRVASRQRFGGIIVTSVEFAGYWKLESRNGCLPPVERSERFGEADRVSPTYVVELQHLRRRAGGASSSRPSCR